MRNILISAVAVLVLGSMSAAQAQSATDKEVVVHYGDLDVNTQDGASVLVKRVEIASAEVCGFQPSNKDISALQAFRACSDAAEARAIKTLPFDVTARMNGTPETLASR